MHEMIMIMIMMRRKRTSSFVISAGVLLLPCARAWFEFKFRNSMSCFEYRPQRSHSE